MSLCRYKAIFGNPNEGAHKYRMFDIAIVDLFSTMLLSLAIARYTHSNFYNVFLILLVAGVLLHRLFCVNTTINTLIFGRV
jgi:hypothetical protein